MGYYRKGEWVHYEPRKSDKGRITAAAAANGSFRLYAAGKRLMRESLHQVCFTPCSEDCLPKP